MAPLRLAINDAGQITRTFTMAIFKPVLDLKGFIGAILKMKIARLTIKLNNQVLEDDELLYNYNFGRFPTVVLRVKPSEGGPEIDFTVKFYGTINNHQGEANSSSWSK
ncbi:hypothetical protein Pint_30950 [Pistacia integerrima]|uniref:Uncharacterized protein n=1 Tax=Pistacia integerrima TaxID=434235 RepID=A0ACC0XNN5_9ROSI|nr:hypothetical protein Pint_30950 [Pistacia integerrima]